MLEFFNYLNSIHPLSAEATTALMKVIRMKELQKGQVWLQEGAVCDKLTFVVKGLMKLYFENGNKELVLSIAKENRAMLAFQSYFEKMPSQYAIRATEPTVIVYFTRSDIDSQLIHFPELNLYYVFFLKSATISLEQHLSLLMLPPKVRWSKLCLSNSWMTDGSRITDRLLAAILGVVPNALCNWRKETYLDYNSKTK